MTPLRLCFFLGKFSTGLHGKIDPHTLYEGRALTGSEGSFFNMVKALSANGHEIDVYCDSISEVCRCERLAGANVFPIENEIGKDYDAYLSLNEPDQLRRAPKDKLRVVWQQFNDFSRVFCKPGFDEFVDIYAALSPVHKNHLIKIAGDTVTPSKFTWLPNSLNIEFFDKKVTRVPHSMAWCSSPDRGLHRLLEIFPAIRKRVPDATLKIFYRFDPWYETNKDGHHPSGIRARYIGECLRRLGRNGENGVSLVGPVNNYKMAEELLATHVFAYTCDCIAFTEGFSVAIMDAMAAGCVSIISDEDAIGDIYRNVPHMIVGKVGDKKEEWIESVVKGMTDPAFGAPIIERGRKYAEKFDRNQIAKIFERFFYGNLNKEMHLLDHLAGNPIENKLITPTSKISHEYVGIEKEASDFIADLKLGKTVSLPWYTSPYVRIRIEEAGFKIRSHTYGDRSNDSRTECKITDKGEFRKAYLPDKENEGFTYWYEPEINTTDLTKQFDEIQGEWWNINIGDVVLDIGAEFGSYTLPALKMGADHVYSWSPSKAHGILQKSVENNGWQNRVTINPTGLWSKDGFVLSQFPEMPKYSETPDDKESFEVQSLDAYYKDSHVGLDRPKKIDVIKIDAEGSEIEILKGAKETIATYRPRMILVENHDFMKIGIAEETRAILAGYGYNEVEYKRSTPHISHSLYKPNESGGRIKPANKGPTQKRPKVSVLLGTNRPGGIDIALSGLAKQSYKDFEVIFVDGRYHQRHQQVLHVARDLGLKQPLIHVPNHRYSNTIWGTTCSGYNTAFALADGELVIMMTDYAYAHPEWIESHVQYQGKVVMAPHEHRKLNNLKFKGNSDLIDFTAMKEKKEDQGKNSDDIIRLILDQRERFSEISVFENFFTPEMLESFPLEEWQEEKTRMETGPIEDINCFNTKNESFPLQSVLDINGMDENYDRGRGPGDPDLGLRLSRTGLQCWIAKEAVLHCLNPRPFLPNLNLIVPENKRLPPPHHERWHFAEGNGYFKNTRDFKIQRARNPFNILDLRKEIWNWREKSQTETPILPKLVIPDQDYFGPG